MNYEDAMNCEKRMTNDGFYFNPNNDEVTPRLMSTYTSRYYKASCPDCNKTAEYKESYFTGEFIDNDHQVLVTISCGHCAYYEFYTQGKDI